jgi:hypothetical protein
LIKNTPIPASPAQPNKKTIRNILKNVEYELHIAVAIISG